MATNDVKITLSATDKTRGAFNSAQQGLARLNSTASNISRTFSGLIPALGVGALGTLAKQGIDAADALNDMSVKLGVSVKDLASLQLIAEQSGTSLETIGKGMQRLQVSIGEAQLGNKEYADSLTRLGVTAKNPREALFQLADAVKQSNDPTKTAADLQKVLSRSYAEMLPLLNEGGQGLRDAALASESFAESMARLAPEADAFNDQLALMKQNMAGVAASVLATVVPSFNEYIAVMKEVIKTGSILDKVRFFALGNASDEIVGKVRKAAEASAAASKAARDARGKVGSVNFTPSRATRTAKAADPLASLLGSTDIGRLKEFDKQVALLNARFDGGRKSTELYNQAMTKLVESTFSANFDEFNKQLAAQDETQRMVAEHLKSTNDALYEQQQAWIDAGKSLEDEMRTPLENANIEFARLQELLDRGVISWETYTRAVFKTQEAISSVPEALQEMDTFAKTAAKNIQNSFADFLFNPFENGLKGMAQSFGQMIQKMIADAVAADLTRRLFGETGSGGAAGGILAGLGEFLGFATGGTMRGAGISAYSGSVVSRPTLFPFASGIGLMGEAGAEAILPLKRGRDGKLGVSSGGGHTINVYVNGTNAPDVRRAAGQGAREALGMLNGARRYG